ncbi:MAG: gliding motility-associated C-terminal domain-containing protein [Sporocytophaga sp.]|nr:gliding motility-associated C-terminal domain-containing protein [Sporocytophaga sp.]
MAGTVFVVDNNGDGDDFQNYNAGTNTLRKCIRLANNTPNGGTPHQIVFSLLAGTVIEVNSDLPTINNNGNAGGLIIDATIAPMAGYNGIPLIGILRKNGPNGYGFNIDGANNVIIRGIGIQNFERGIRVNNSSGSTLDKNFIGTNLAGNSIAGTSIQKDGILLDNNAGNTTISNNLISGCITVNDGGWYGAIHVRGSNNNGVKIISNLIGTDVNGTNLLGNGNNQPYRHHGVFIEGASTTANPIVINGNTISGSVGNGIFANNNSSGLRITGNHIGTDKLGTKAIPNKGAGIYLESGSGHIIGGSTPAERNVISGNGGAKDSRPCGPEYCGEPCHFSERRDNRDPCPDAFDATLQVGIYFTNVSNSKISGNYIGTNNDGTSTGVNNSLGNFYAGIKMEAGSNNNTVGGITEQEGNVIGGNGFGIYNNSSSAYNGQGYRGHGIQLNGGSVRNITITNNYVGVSKNNLDIGNRQDGISLLGARDCIIGTSDYPNVVGFNSWGIFLQSDFAAAGNSNQTSNNSIKGNFIGIAKDNSNIGNGTRVLDDEGAGIGIQHGSINNTFEANKISFNRDGITLRGQGKDPFGAPVKVNNFYGNYIGTDISGLTAKPNQNNGFWITQGAKQLNIGGTLASQRNIIAGNTKDGIHIESGDSIKIFNNYIGVNVNGAALANGGDGIKLSQPTNDLGGGSRHNIIGGVGTNEANIIANNGGNGVVVSGTNSINNSIHHNSFSCNALRGIVLSNGGNNSYAAPTFSGTPEAFTLTGPAGSFIELYALDNCNNCDAGTNNKLQGLTLIASGLSPLTPTAAQLAGRTNNEVTAIASAGSTTAAHNTSEFSACTTLCIKPEPKITRTDGFAICANTKNVTFTTALVAGNNYVWSVNGGLTLVGVATNESITVNVGSTGGTITLTETAGACSTTVTQAITVNPLPTINITADTAVICNETLPALTANALPANSTYQWKDAAGNDIANQTANTFTPSAPGWYKVQATSQEGCKSALDSAYVEDKSITVDLNPKGSVFICDDKPVDLKALVTPSTPLKGVYTFEWYQGITKVQSGTSDTYSTKTNGDYTVTVSNDKCSATSPVATISNSTLEAKIDLTGTQVICDNNALELTASPMITGVYIWKRNGVEVQNGPSNKYSTSLGGKYTVTVIAGSAAACSDESDTLTIENKTVDVIAKIDGNGVICDDTAILITADTSGTNTGTIEWYKNGVLITNTGLTYSTKETGKYTVKLINGPCSDVSNEIEIINNTVTIDASITGGNIICDNKPIEVKADTTGTNAGIIKWYRNGILIPNASGLSVDALASGQYSVSIHFGLCSDSANGVAIINDTKKITAGLSGSDLICNNLPIVITADTIGGGPGTLKWYKNGVLISGESGLTLSTNETGEYTVSINDGMCSDSSLSVKITNNSKEISANIVGDTIICDDKEITIVADTTLGSGTLVWYKNGQVINGQSGLEYTTKETGDYKVIVIGGGCSDTSATVSIKNNTIDASATLAGSGLICNDQPITITASATPAKNNYQFEWLKNEVAISGASASTHSTAETGKYRVIISGDGCTDTSAVASIFNGTILISLKAQSDTICKGLDTDISVAITKGGIPQINYVWKASQGGNPVANNDTINVQPETTTTYTVTVSDSTTCSVTRSVEVAVITVPETPLSANVDRSVICNTDTRNIELSATPGTDPKIRPIWYKDGCGLDSVTTGYTVSITPPDSTTTYYIALKNVCGISECKSVNVKVNRDPKDDLIDAFVSDTSICSAYTGEIRLSVDTIYNPDAVINWYMKDRDLKDSIIGHGNPYKLPKNPKDTTYYYVYLYVEACLPSPVDSVPVNVIDPKVDAGGVIGDKYVYCRNEDRAFVFGSVRPAGVDWKWVPENPSAPVLFDPARLVSQVNTKSPAETQKWYLIADNKICKPVIDSMYLTIHDLPVVTLDIPQDTLCSKVEFDAVATVVKGVPNAYVWLTPNSSMPDTSYVMADHTNPLTKRFTAEVAGRNYFLVTVVDTNGCWAELPAIDSVEIFDHQELVIPNLMTPNHDGKNETYIIRDINNYDILPGAKLEVYNRWGERVYRNSSYDNSWDAANISDGIYYYYLKTGCAKDEYKGWLHIISNNNRNE